MEFIKEISSQMIIPVIEINDANKSEDLADALMDGGLNCVEITFRTDCAADVIKRMNKYSTKLHIIAGTILTIEQVKIVSEAGAMGIVSPSINRKVVEYCMDNSMPVIPGVSTPSEIDIAFQYNLRYAKLFPAELLGGVEYINAISAPYPMMKFMPTGGIGLNNLPKYLSCNNVFSVGGSWIAKKELIDSGCFDRITQNARKALNTVMNACDYKRINMRRYYNE